MWKTKRERVTASGRVILPRCFATCHHPNCLVLSSASAGLMQNCSHTELMYYHTDGVVYVLLVLLVVKVLSWTEQSIENVLRTILHCLTPSCIVRTHFYSCNWLHAYFIALSWSKEDTGGNGRMPNAGYHPKIRWPTVHLCLFVVDHVTLCVTVSRWPTSTTKAGSPAWRNSTNLSILCWRVDSRWPSG